MPQMGYDTKTDRLTDCQSQCDSLSLWTLTLKESTFETPDCQDVSFGAEELNWVESSELAVAE
jgi:hypothetical protein